METTSFISDFENSLKQIKKQISDYIEFLLSKYPKKDNKYHLEEIGKY